MMLATEQKTRTYSFIENGDQPLTVLKAFKERMIENGINHPMMDSKRFETVYLPPGIDKSKFIREFLELKGEPGVIYICIVELKNRYEWEVKMVPNGKAKKKDHIVKGARKWETCYVVYRHPTAEELEKTGHSGPIELGIYSTKGESAEFAKEQAFQTGQKTFVELEKRLVGSPSRVLDIEPELVRKKDRVDIPDNEYLFFGLTEGAATE